MVRRTSGPTFDDLLVRIGANVQRLRRAARMTQAELAEAIDVTVEHLRGVEGGYRTASLRVLFEAARTLEADVDQLVLPAPRTARTPGRPRSRRDEA